VNPRSGSVPTSPKLCHVFHLRNVLFQLGSRYLLPPLAGGFFLLFFFFVHVHNFPFTPHLFRRFPLFPRIRAIPFPTRLYFFFLVCFSIFFPPATTHPPLHTPGHGVPRLHRIFGIYTVNFFFVAHSMTTAKNPLDHAFLTRFSRFTWTIFTSFHI